jgi:hypothetical protein
MKSKLEMRLSIVALAALFSSGQVLAQDESAQGTAIEDDDEAIEQIIVTGSRLKRDSFNVSTPLVSLDSDALTDAGLGSMALILIDEDPDRRSARDFRVVE